MCEEDKKILSEIRSYCQRKNREKEKKTLNDANIILFRFYYSSHDVHTGKSRLPIVDVRLLFFLLHQEKKKPGAREREKKNNE